jgi:hypothetical protein
LHSHIPAPSHAGNCGITSNAYDLETIFRPIVEFSVPSNVPSVFGAVSSAQQAAQKMTGGAPPPATNAGSPADRIVLQGSPLPALLIGATVAAQLVPGVIEAEGATGAATAIGIAVRAATANPAAKALVAAGAGAAGTYVKSLMHDATAGQPVFTAVSSFGHAVDASVRAGLGIPPSAEH